MTSMSLFPDLSRSHFASKVARDGVASKLSIVDLAGSFVSFAHAMVLRCIHIGANMCQFNVDAQITQYSWILLP